MSSAPHPEQDGSVPDTLPELLFLFTIFGVVMFVAAAWLFAL